MKPNIQKWDLFTSLSKTQQSNLLIWWPKKRVGRAVLCKFWVKFCSPNSLFTFSWNTWTIMLLFLLHIWFYLQVTKNNGTQIVPNYQFKHSTLLNECCWFILTTLFAGPRKKNGCDFSSKPKTGIEATLWRGMGPTPWCNGEWLNQTVSLSF